jgi:hypothetical protein
MKSGLELLEELIEQVKLLNTRFEVTEQNIKILLNKSNELAKPQIQANNQLATVKPVEVKPPEPIPKGGIRAIGKVIKDNKIVINVEVQVFDKENKLIKRTKTNRAGEWVCFLMPGTYAIHYFLKNVLDANATFTIGPEDKIVRVAALSV